MISLTLLTKKTRIELRMRMSSCMLSSRMQIMVRMLLVVGLSATAMLCWMEMAMLKFRTKHPVKKFTMTTLKRLMHPLKNYQPSNSI